MDLGEGIGLGLFAIFFFILGIMVGASIVVTSKKKPETNLITENELQVILRTLTPPMDTATALQVIALMRDQGFNFREATKK